MALPWLLVWTALLLAGGFVIVRMDIAERREAFQADARIAHRLLSQRMVQHDAIVETLVLLGPSSAVDPQGAERRLGAIYPQLLAVHRRRPDGGWPDEALREAEARSRASRHAEVAAFDAAEGRYALVLAGEPDSVALRIDLQRTVPWDTWPLPRAGPVQVALQHGAQRVLLQPGEPVASRPVGLTGGFSFTKALASPGQPFELQLQRATGPAQWPWRGLAAWAGLSGLALAVLATRRAQRRERDRAQALLRLEQTARLGTLGELAGGIAHELNQPLAAVLANTQAARRLLDDDPPELATARDAMAQAAAQARRAADVLARLRRLVEAPDAARPQAPVLLQAVVRNAAALLAPEARRRGITLAIEGESPAVLGDAVAVEQIVHNLAANAMQALDAVPASERRLVLAVRRDGTRGLLSVRDSGPGIAADALPLLFEPFYTTKPGGLGLGLSLCESLARAMHGTLAVRPAPPRGAEFELTLPLAAASADTASPQDKT